MVEKIEQYSLGKTFKLTFFDFKEPKMCENICKFSLTDLQNNETIEFNPLWTIGSGKSGFSWSENQKIISLPIAYPANVFFIYDIENKKFTSIHFENCWILTGYCHNNFAEIEYNENIECENEKYPTKDLSKPRNLKFIFSELEWIDITNLHQFEELNKNAFKHELKPIDHGWRHFKGQLPQNTNTLIWEIKKFAEYGDEQSQNWFSEIEKHTSDINFWVEASRYIGLKIRS
jgi:hypothetical protein